MKIKLFAFLRQQLCREPVRRALRTFFQAAAGYAVVNVATLDFSTRDAVLGFFMATVAAGLAAAMNMEEDSNEDLS